MAATTRWAAVRTGDMVAAKAVKPTLLALLVTLSGWTMIDPFRLWD